LLFWVCFFVEPEPEAAFHLGRDQVASIVSTVERNLRSNYPKYYIAGGVGAPRFASIGIEVFPPQRRRTGAILET
jgi:hypothetical protein